MKRFITGLIVGVIISTTITSLAVEYFISENPYPVIVDGSNITIEGYNINNNTYFKLRDIADAVGGFNVTFENDSILLTTEKKDMNSTIHQFTNSLYETIDNIDYMSVQNAGEYIDKITSGSLEWILTYPTNYPELMWCVLNHMGGISGNDVIEEFQITTVNINNKQYISKETFENDILKHIQ